MDGTNMNYIETYLQEVKVICDSISKKDVGKFAKEIDTVKANKGRLFFLGVGGSAGNASHAVNDFRKIYPKKMQSSYFQLVVDRLPHHRILRVLLIWQRKSEQRFFRLLAETVDIARKNLMFVS